MRISGSIATRHGEAELHLLPQRAVWWPATRTLIVADVHLGKATAFRTLGVPVPTGSSAKDLQRLSNLLTMTAATRLIVLGDLVHARRSHQAQLGEALLKWRGSHTQITMILVRGNHDRHAGRLVADLQIEEVEQPTMIDGMWMRHDPVAESSAMPTLAGHVHPVVTVQDFDRSAVRLPCFVFGPDGVGVLPSFGTFTGGANVRHLDGQRCYACAGSRVVPIAATT